MSEAEKDRLMYSEFSVITENSLYLHRHFQLQLKIAHNTI